MEGQTGCAAGDLGAIPARPRLGLLDGGAWSSHVGAPGREREGQSAGTYSLHCAPRNVRLGKGRQGDVSQNGLGRPCERDGADGMLELGIAGPDKQRKTSGRERQVVGERYHLLTVRTQRPAGSFGGQEARARLVSWSGHRSEKHGHGPGRESMRELEREKPSFLGVLVRRCSHGGGRVWRTRPWLEEEAFGESGWDGFWLVGSAAEGDREEGIRGHRQRQQDRMHTISQSVRPSFPQSVRQSVII